MTGRRRIPTLSLRYGVEQAGEQWFVIDMSTPKRYRLPIAWTPADGMDVMF